MKDFFELDIVNIYMFLELLTFFFKKLTFGIISLNNRLQINTSKGFQKKAGSKKSAAQNRKLCKSG